MRKLRDFLPETFRCHYSWKILRKDLLAGITVGVIALPLAMAFAIASGLRPEQGLYTAIVAGFLSSFFGGSRFLIGGPIGAFVVIVYEIVQREGYSGLIISTLIAAILLILMGFARLGTLIKYIPIPLVTGFTAGIAVMIFSSQVKDFLGLALPFQPADFILKWQAVWQALPTWDPLTASVGGGTLLLMIGVRRFFPTVPWAIAGIVFATFLTWFFDLPVDTVGSRYGTMTQIIPLPILPEFTWSFERILHHIPDGVTIALLAGIEALLCAVIADGMTGTKHRSNTELVGQGLANLGSCFFGGMPAAAAMARTAINVKSGGRTPFSGMIHAMTMLGVLLLFSSVVSRVPLAALASILIVIAWNMCEWDRFRCLFRAPPGDIVVLLTALLLTVLVDLTVALEVGMILASFLFMKRVSDLSKVTPITPLLKEEGLTSIDPDAIGRKVVPEGVEVYEIDGPFFFGATDRLQNALINLERPPKIFILRMGKVPAIDVTGLDALANFSDVCQREGTHLLLSGVKPKLKEAFHPFGIEKKVGKENILSDIDSALKRAHHLIESV
ncbi:MAG: sulfate permease [Verrucomicrobia bacterium]|nr:sulfate permease [Verrucomicrobiota bacterium]